MTLAGELAGLAGAEAPPRSNGELVFEEPWQARAFGLALGLVQELGLGWDEFRGRLIEEIARAERENAGAPAYYERWLAALERLVVERGLVGRAELEERAAQAAAADRHR